MPLWEGVEMKQEREFLKEALINLINKRAKFEVVEDIKFEVKSEVGYRGEVFDRLYVIVSFGNIFYTIDAPILSDVSDNALMEIVLHDDILQTLPILVGNLRRDLR